MNVKFIRSIVTNFGSFDAGKSYDLTPEQVDYLTVLNPDDIEVGKLVKSNVN